MLNNDLMNRLSICTSHTKCYRVIALISVNIVWSFGIEARELVSVRRYPNKGHYLPIPVR